MAWRILSVWRQSGGRRHRAAKATTASRLIAAAAAAVAEVLERRQFLSTTWFVATNGSDSNPGTLAAPFQTIQHAANLAQAGDTVLIRGGIYHETVTPANSGAGGAPITYAAYNNESVTVDGADPVANWSATSTSGVYSATMGWDLGEGNNQVFVDGQVQTEARWPNIGSNLSRPAQATAQGATVSGGTVTIYDSNLTQASGYWNGAIIHFTPGQQWVAYTATVTASGPGFVSFTYTASSADAAVSAGTSYYLVGKLAAIDSPGEWFYNPAGQTLSLAPSTADSPANHLVEAKHRQYGFNLAGVWQTTIRGINFFACTINTDGNSWNDTFDHISMQYVSQFIAQPDGWSEPYACGMLLAGKYDLLESSTIAYSSGDGVFVTGNNVRITNTVIHDVGLNGQDSGGIRNYGYFNSFDHNTIYNAGRDGIGAFGGYSQFVYNTIYNCMLQTADGGGIYTWQSDGTGSLIGYNRISNVITGGYGGVGVYLDNSSYNWTVVGNITSNVNYALKINNDSLNNHIYNNTFDATQFGLGTGGWTSFNWTGTILANDIFTQPLNGGESFETFENNIYYGTNPQLNSDYTLKATSPAINAGMVIPPYTNGYIGSAPDMGALEYGSMPFGSGALLDWTPVGPTFSATTAASSPPPPPPIVPSGPLATSQIAALSYANQQGIFGYAGAVAYFDSGDWVEYGGVNFGTGVSKFSIALAVPAGYQGRQIQLRIDGLGGAVIGTLTTQATSGWGDYEVQSTAVADVTGVHNLYLIGAGGGTAIGNYSWFTFAPASTTSVGASATYVGSDTWTMGNWNGVYGSDGYWTIGGTPTLPAYASATVANPQYYQWEAQGTTDVRAAQMAAGSSTRIASAYYGPSISMDLNLTDGKAHQVALYLLDADWLHRSETVQISDASSGAVLASTDLKSFMNGDYLVYNLTGHVKITIASDAGSPNAVISGIYFAPAR